MSLEQHCARLRRLSCEASILHLNESAIFYAEKVVILTSGAHRDVYMLAQAYFVDRQYRRALALLRRYDMLLPESSMQHRYLGALCLAETKAWEECLELLGPPPLPPHPPAGSTVSDFVRPLEEGYPGAGEGISMSAAVLTLRARAHAGLEILDQEVAMYQTAAQTDAYCYEAVHALLARHLLSDQEEVDMLSKLEFHAQDSWLQSLYRIQCKKYKNLGLLYECKAELERPLSSTGSQPPLRRSLPFNPIVGGIVSSPATASGHKRQQLQQEQQQDTGLSSSHPTVGGLAAAVPAGHNMQQMQQQLEQEQRQKQQQQQQQKAFAFHRTIPDSTPGESDSAQQRLFRTPDPSPPAVVSSPAGTPYPPTIMLHPSATSNGQDNSTPSTPAMQHQRVLPACNGTSTAGSAMPTATTLGGALGSPMSKLPSSVNSMLASGSSSGIGSSTHPAASPPDGADMMDIGDTPGPAQGSRADGQASIPLTPSPGQHTAAHQIPAPMAEGSTGHAAHHHRHKPSQNATPVVAATSDDRMEEGKEAERSSRGNAEQAPGLLGCGLGGSVDVMAASADLAFDRGQHEDSFNITRSGLEADPFALQLVSVYCASAVEMGRKNELFMLGHRLVEEYPDSALSWFAVGCYYRITQQWLSARRHFGKATVLDPTFAPAWIGFAHAFSAQDERDQAMAAYRMAGRLFRGLHLPLLGQGVEYCQMMNLPLAERMILGAYDMCPDDPRVVYELAVLMYRCCHYAAVAIWCRHALCLMQHAEEGDGVLRGGWDVVLVLYAHALRKQQAYPEAIELYQQALSVAPGVHSTHSALAFTHHLMGRLSEAVSGYHAALALKPDDAFAGEMLNCALVDFANFDTSLE